MVGSKLHLKAISCLLVRRLHDACIVDQAIDFAVFSPQLCGGRADR